ncbi:1,4-alpha-glucan branching protein [Streptomyces sp. NPDC006512]|uniref:maltokinase N-terminal cap-like domain-containing protein n=1 Tax=Streptomyces sp. NPDC006512 TaxID=3154307 RepID=UPI0033BD60BB
MAVIHRTTLTPTKLELLAGWLPSRPWYGGGRDTASLARAGGFRLDDPEGEVGIEFLVVTDGAGDAAAAHLVPLTYRGAPLPGADAGLIGTCEHGVLGTRWVYDGAHDPVLVGQLLALLAGGAVAQAQSESDTPDPTVEVRPAAQGAGAGLTGPGPVVDTADATVVAVGPEDGEGPALNLTVSRRLRPGPAAGDDVRGQVLARWSAPDGSVRSGSFAVLREVPRLP